MPKHGRQTENDAVEANWLLVTIIHQARHVLRMYGPPVWWQVGGDEDPCWRQIALLSGIVIAWHPAICRYSRPLCVPTFTSLMLGWVATGGKSLPKSIHAQGCIPTPAGLVSTFLDQEREKVRIWPPAAKAVPGWRALTIATGHNKSLWQIQRTSGAIGSAIDSVCPGLGLASLVRAVDSSVQARDFTVRAHPAGAPQPGLSCRPDTRDLSQALNFKLLTGRLLNWRVSIWIGAPTCHLSDPWDLCECFGNRALPLSDEPGQRLRGPSRPRLSVPVRGVHRREDNYRVKTLFLGPAIL